jgi:hypothetical protein
MSRLKHLHSRALTAIVLGVIAGGSAAGFALADTSTDTATQTTTVAAIQQVPPSIAAAFPALRKALDSSEAQQLPEVAQVMSILTSRGALASAGGANSALARRISRAGEDAEYLVPGNAVLCMVSVGHATGGGCAPQSSVETAGSTSMTVVPGGYEVSGILPRSTSTVSITDASGQTSTVAANANHAFHYFSAAPLARLAYDLPSGGQHVGSLALPPPPDIPPPPAG